MADSYHASNEVCKAIADDIINQLITRNAPLSDIIRIIISQLTSVIFALKGGEQMEIIEVVRDSLDMTERRIMAKSAESYKEQLDNIISNLKDD